VVKWYTWSFTPSIHMSRFKKLILSSYVIIHKKWNKYTFNFKNGCIKLISNHTFAIISRGWIVSFIHNELYKHMVMKQDQARRHTQAHFWWNGKKDYDNKKCIGSNNSLKSKISVLSGKRMHLLEMGYISRMQPDSRVNLPMLEGNHMYF